MLLYMLLYWVNSRWRRAQPLYLWLLAGRENGPAQAELLSWLRQVYAVTAWNAPCLDAVPLLELAGWTEGDLAHNRVSPQADAMLSMFRKIYRVEGAVEPM